MIGTMTAKYTTLSAEEKGRVREINRETCLDAAVGSWIGLFGYQGLIKALMLDEGSFLYAYPDLALEIHDRPAALDRVIAHYKICKRCQLVERNFVWARLVLQSVIATATSAKTASSKPAKLADRSFAAAGGGHS